MVAAVNRPVTPVEEDVVDEGEDVLADDGPVGPRGGRRRHVAQPTRATVGTSDEVCLSFLRYGEEAPDAAERHLLGQAWKVYDTAGLIITEAVDVDGHVTESTRRHVARYFPLPDWTAHAAAPDTATDPDWVQTADGADDEVYTQTATFDVGGRPVADAIWRDASAKHERRYAYDAGGRLTGVDVRLRSTDAADWRPVVHDVTYNARGQRVVVRTGDVSGAAAVQTDHSYAPETFRLLRIRTERLSDDAVLQDYRWVHDAVGNITFQENQGDDTIWYDNGTIAPHRAYRYDALDRLTEATGREHASTFDTSAGYPGSQGQTSSPYGTGPVAHKADGTALRSYTQTYTYDDVGNFLELRHVQGGTGGVTSVRTYAYTVESDGSLFNNQLHRTTVGSTNYDHAYDLHGNTTSMANLLDMAWDPLDRMASVQTQARSQDVRPDPDRAPAHDWFYQYDGSGQRVRKVRAVLVEYDAVGDPGVLVADGVLRSEERFYVGPFEVWRRYNVDGSTDTDRETLHVMDDQRRVAMVETLTWEDDAAVEAPAGRWRYQLDDHLGTSCGEVTAAGLEIGWEEYHPYGTTALSSFDATREVSGKRYRYTGMERDEETGLAYHSARYYAAWVGRWTSADPVDLAGGMNLYAYCGRRTPVAATDRSGQADFWEAAGAWWNGDATAAEAWQSWDQVSTVQGGAVPGQPRPQPTTTASSESGPASPQPPALPPRVAYEPRVPGILDEQAYLRATESYRARMQPARVSQQATGRPGAATPALTAPPASSVDVVGNGIVEASGVHPIASVSINLGKPVAVGYPLLMAGLQEGGLERSRMDDVYTVRDAVNDGGMEHATNMYLAVGPIRNISLRGGAHPVTGVPFDEYGYPDFSRWRHPQYPDVRITLTGSRSKDEALANAASGLSQTPEGYTWHHHQDAGLMQLIDYEIHRKTGHTGGFSGPGK